MVASNNGRKYCVNTILHVTMQILCYYGNIMNMFRRKYLKFQCEKTTSKRQEKIRLHSHSLSFFQSSFSEFCVKILDKDL